MRLDTGQRDPRFSRRQLLLAVGGVLAALLLFGGGFALSALLLGGTDGDGQHAAAPTAGPSKTVSRTALATRSVTITVTPRAVASTPVAPSSTAPSPTAVPPTATATATPDFTKQPSVEVVSLDPPLGTHLEVASVEIKIGVSYQAGRDSNVLAWELYYCLAPNECNTYGSRNETEVTPGANGSVVSGGTFPAGGNYLRPIVVCRYTVTIGHYLTPEAQWQSQMSSDERCQGGEQRASIRITGVTPDIGSDVSEGEVVTAYVEYNALGADQIQMISRGDNCVILGSRTIDIERDSSGVETIHITTSPPGTGTLREVEALLLDGGAVKGTYNYGGC